MAEYVLGPDEDQETVARALLDAAGDPELVMWSPRPNMHPHGGVYVIDDEHADRIIATVTGGSVETVQGVPVDAEPAADEDVETDEEKAEDAADEAVVDDPNTPEDEHQQGQDRVAARKAARAAARAAAEQKSE